MLADTRMGVNLVQRIRQLVEKSGFLLPVNNVCEGVQFGPAGQLLKSNISHEWFQSNSMETLDNVFPLDQQFQQFDNWNGLKAAFEHACQLTGSRLPFGFAEIRPCETPSSLLQAESSELAWLTPHKATLARTRKFERPAAADKLFDHWQTQRKMWWRKFSNSPGHISIESTGQKSVSVFMKLPDLPPLTVETIKQLGDQPFQDMPRELLTSFEVKDGRKLVLPHVVESCTTLEMATLTFLCDAYEEREGDHQVLALHRKLAPYKVAFAAAPAGTTTVGQDIVDLASFLSRVLRRAGVSSLLLPDLGKRSLESQLVRFDELGVPYCVVLNEGALKNGTIGLRNRDTTLKEQVHVAELKKYVKLLLKNY